MAAPPAWRLVSPRNKADAQPRREGSPRAGIPGPRSELMRGVCEQRTRGRAALLATVCFFGARTKQARCSASRQLAPLSHYKFSNGMGELAWLSALARQRDKD